MEHANSAGHIVVLAVDNSVPSDMAFKFYVDNVSRPGYLLHLVHHSNYWGNFEPMDGGGFYLTGPSPKHCQELMAKEDSKVKEIENKYRKLMAENNIIGDFIVLRGKDAWHDIIQYQEKVNGIMIVMGTRGQNTLRRTFMGSVSDSVVHHASCPVLVCCHPKI
ncbi:universal stress protein YxiE-like isoform X1 [Biomphalaria glabrata]|uniref:Universal stress protein YxiE-like isoform X1 n=2 Tax=Biomphalaria glabrata TaxID=6526 RepID=A0A9W3A421_BIOGL|nr:universal stress protein YxiE-like isoform X1 [Biomphalaria glabrata]XP_055881956.1 universal stress protein YxiE-like isoform X1 [Biomphalaria glabrata]XP_055881958.1 universal stress protein YxiE-like isoform X1 [Biomphalaria glabrata]XP_055881959.1 universal stress protein YxiE-like isoform X1 [Biomphalaria glabrata]